MQEQTYQVILVLTAEGIGFDKVFNTGCDECTKTIIEELNLRDHSASSGWFGRKVKEGGEGLVAIGQDPPY